MEDAARGRRRAEQFVLSEDDARELQELEGAPESIIWDPERPGVVFHGSLESWLLTHPDTQYARKDLKNLVTASHKRRAAVLAKRPDASALLRSLYMDPDYLRPKACSRVLNAVGRKAQPQSSGKRVETILREAYGDHIQIRWD